MHPAVKLHRGMSPTTPADRDAMSTVPYRTIVGMLLYLMVCSRPDIAYAVCPCARFMDSYGLEHWRAVQVILKYLVGTKDLRITYRRLTSVAPVLHGYSDADWASNDLDTRHSHTGFVFFLSGGPVAWKSRLQTSVSLSSMDAEYYAMGDSTKEAISLRDVLGEVDRHLTDDERSRAVQIRVDNVSAIQLSRNPVFHKRSKHIALRHHFLRDMKVQELVSFEYVPSEYNIADVLTKPFTSVSFVSNVSFLWVLMLRS